MNHSKRTTGIAGTTRRRHDHKQSPAAVGMQVLTKDQHGDTKRLLPGRLAFIAMGGISFPLEAPRINKCDTAF